MYWQEFFTIALLHLIAVASPGPDFAVTTRYSFSYGRNIGRWVALGIGVGILLHVTYSVLGIALVIHRYQWIYASLLLVGALYLGYLGVQALQATAPSQAPTLPTDRARSEAHLTAWQAFRIGFLTNGLNVKATLFFFMLFSTVIAPQTPTLMKAAYGLYMALATALWFAALATLITWAPLYQWLWRRGHWLDRLMGLALLLLAAHLLWQWLQLLEVVVAQ